ncbi:AhpC/TSA family protein [Rhizobium sp. P32RR-XVIII]|uniref:peroxiredoxin-like family protein n=1 Tax=Rhizobium sp. P32RR-XVIII TaxID=2726738 RepID=UPI0014568C0D|nr:peroxiredoxin-like family protein [Rhizobium sp. P32RR-XVIII]NLS07590.1 AhpC/TSA family protein [Rhizobium sp. P32RR-XVIII]
MNYDKLRGDLLAAFGPADWEAYDFLVKRIREHDFASRALKVGDTAPDFLLPDADGRLVSSEQLRREGPLVISFFRGGWCQYCTAELCGLQAAKQEFEDLKANLLVLSPDTGDFPREMKRSFGLDLQVLADVDHGVAMSYGVLFSVPEETRAYYSSLKIDLGKRHGSSMWMLPLPATYVVDRNGQIQSAFIEPDFTIRQEPTEILAAVRRLASESLGEPASARSLGRARVRFRDSRANTLVLPSSLERRTVAP